MSGMVVLDENGMIQKFIEKPCADQQVSNLVNAGIYICSPRVLQFVPEGVSDFGKNIIPALIAAGEPLASHLLEEELLAIDTPELLDRARNKLRG
jgi:NDP-sugar pyrophosphorylase family protein